MEEGSTEGSAPSALARFSSSTFYSVGLFGANFFYQTGIYFLWVLTVLWSLKWIITFLAMAYGK